MLGRLGAREESDDSSFVADDDDEDEEETIDAEEKLEQVHYENYSVRSVAITHELMLSLTLYLDISV